MTGGHKSGDMCASLLRAPIAFNAYQHLAKQRRAVLIACCTDYSVPLGELTAER
jgi:hypothetical protein